jgi:hypothetical protein
MTRRSPPKIGAHSRRSPGTLYGLASAALLLVAGVWIGWLSFRSAIVRTLPPTTPEIVRFALDDSETVLGTATGLLVTRRGVLDAATLDAVRRAAVAAPLDARPYLILGHQQLLDGASRRAVATLEAGQRLDPRQRLIHLLLLDRYLRTGRYADAATQFSVLARLLGAAQAPIASAMAQMTMAPETRDAVRRTLHGDPLLERAVLTALAKSDTPPDTIFALASPAARADASTIGSWGPTLVARLVEQGRYATARSAWQRIYAVPPAQAAVLVTNASFGKTVPSPPFDWTLTAGSLGAADLKNGSLTVEYYGRDSGDLARQMLVLRPGRYRFSFALDPGKTDATSKLFWSLACESASDTGTIDGKTALMTVAVAAVAKPRRIAADLVVPPGCPAQTLALRGEAGDFPAPVDVTIRDLDLRPLSDAARDITP